MGKKKQPGPDYPAIACAYLIHIENSPLIKQGRVIQHYCGATGNLKNRMALHNKGRGAKMLAAAINGGATLVVARIWEGDFITENKLKRRHDRNTLCPICYPKQSKRGNQ